MNAWNVHYALPEWILAAATMVALVLAALQRFAAAAKLGSFLSHSPCPSLLFRFRSIWP